ncbi:MAG TPA: SRPBCC family protein [Steroidobacteraceae bacterium]|nr:SRPBCC family protein [Steroidobacteraceae bacterium]
MPSTIRLHRVFAAPPERIYKAFTDADARCKWLPPYGFTAKMHSDDQRVGGSYKMSFTNFSTGSSSSFGGEYKELVPGERVRYTDKFDDPNLPGAMNVTVTFKKTVVGTEVDITQEGVPDVIPAAACYLGWQESLAQLELLVEPEIPDGG